MGAKMELEQKKILITGAAGFIGFHVAKRLLEQGLEITGLDNLNDYYDVNLKKDRLQILEQQPGFSFVKAALEDQSTIEALFDQEKFDLVIHLAAQAGVRYSLENPRAYINSNIMGFMNILEGCRNTSVKHLVYASSSSVYGANAKVPFAVSDNVDHPVSLYAATKKSNELMAHTYSSLFGLPTTGLRFFTVYGPWGRPDMAYFSFTKSILEGKPIDVFNNGQMQRDFTYIDDIVEGIILVSGHIPQPDPDWNAGDPDPASSYAPYRLYNIGNHSPVELGLFIEIIEQALGKKAKKNLLPMQPGDVLRTFADVEDLTRDVGFKPATTLEAGIDSFISWFREYYRM